VAEPAPGPGAPEPLQEVQQNAVPVAHVLVPTDLSGAGAQLACPADGCVRVFKSSCTRTPAAGAPQAVSASPAPAGKSAKS